MPFTGNELRNLNNVIKERHLDPEIDAETFTVNDVADYFTATTIESVLAEIHGNTKYLSNGVFEDGGYTDNLDGTITLNNSTATLAAGPRQLREIHTIIGGITGTDFPAINDIGSVYYVVVKFNSGTPVFDVLNGSALSLIDEIEYVPYLTIVRDGNNLAIVEWDEMGDNLVNKLHARVVKTHRFERESGFVLSEDTGRIVKINGGTLWNGANKLSFTDFASDVDDMELWYHSGGSWTKSAITQYNNTQYDNGINLQTLTDGKYAINWIYKCAGNPKEVRIVLGEGDYTVGEAKASTGPIGLPDMITKVSFLVGRIIVKKNDTNAQIIDNPFVIYSFSPFAPHGELDGLDQDDHVQYILHNGTRAMTGNLNLGDQDITDVKKLTLTGGVPTIEFINGGKGTIYHDGNLVVKADDNNLSLDAELEIDAWKTLDMNTNRIKNVGVPTANDDAIPRSFLYDMYDFKTDPTGFIDAENEVHMYITGSTFYIEPKTTSFKYLKNGRRYTVTSTQSVNLATAGSKGDLLFIYYDTNNVLTASNTPWSFGLGLVFIALSYWWEDPAVPGVAKHTLANELHGAKMSDATHHYLHDSVGTRYVRGLGGVFYGDASYDISDGEIYDEDLPTITAGASPYTAGTILYRDSTLDWVPEYSTNWYKQDISDYPYYDNNGVLTAVGLNKYCVSWIFAVNGYTTRIACFMGQHEYASLGDAQASSLESDMLFGQMYTVEFKLLYKVILQNKAGTGTNIVSDTQDFRLNVSLPGSTPTLTSHSTLSGLLNDDHPQYILANGSRSLSANWNVGNTISGVDQIQFDLTHTPTPAVGNLHWDSDKGTLQLGMPGGNISLQIGQELLFKGYNGTGTTLYNGRAVSAVGLHDGNLSIAYTDSSDNDSSGLFIGVLSQDVADGNYGYVCIIGLVHGVNTSSYPAGSLLYVDPASPGNYVNIRPTAPTNIIAPASVIVSDAVNGIMGVKPVERPRLEALSDVLDNDSKTGKEVPIWDNGNSRYEIRELAEADISDLATYLKIDGSLPMTGNLLMANNTSVSWRDALDTKWIEGVKIDANNNLLLKHDSGKKIIADSLEITDNLSSLSNVTITGNLTVNGTEFITNTETVEIEDNMGIINANETGAGVTAGFAGWEVERGTETNYRFGFDETSDSFQLGIVGSLQTVATRPDSGSLHNNGLAVWDSANLWYGTDANLLWDETSLTIGSSKNLVFTDGGSVNIINSTYVANNTSLMTSLAIATKIENYGYVLNPMTSNLDSGGYDLTNLGDVYLNTGKKIRFVDGVNLKAYITNSDTQLYLTADTEILFQPYNGLTAYFSSTGLIMASGKNIVMSGASTLTTGTGALSLNGNTTIATGKNLIFTDGGSVNIINTTFVDNDTSLMTSQAIKEKIENYGYSTTVGTVTSVTGSAPVVSSGGATPQISMAVANSTTNGYMSSSYANKVDGIDVNANNYTHPSGDGNLHVIATSTTNDGKVLTAGATAGSLSWETPTVGTVTDVTGTSPIISSGGVTPDVSIQVATSAQHGYLSSTNWTTFNNKEEVLTFSTGLTRTINDIACDITQYTNANAIAAVEGESTLDLTGDVSIASAKKITHTNFEIVYTAGTDSLDFNYIGV